MKQLNAVLTALVVFGWMAAAGVFFLSVNPGVLASPDAFLAIPRSIQFSLTVHSFHSWPLEIVGALAFSIWAVAVFFGTGLWMAKALGARNSQGASPCVLMSALEKLAVATALGMGAWGLAVLAIGAAGLLRPVVLAAALIVASLLSLPVLGDWFHDLRQKPLRRPRGWAEWVAAVLSASALVLGLLYALTPAIQSDGLRYHMAAPQVWLREGRIVYLPFNAFTNFPFLIEMLFTLALGLAGDMAAKMMHFACFVLCGLFAALLAARLLEGMREGENHCGTEAMHAGLGRALPLLGGLVFWTTPTALITGAWEFIDLGTALFFLAMLYALARWHRTAECAGKRFWRLVAACLLGFLLGTKYTMLAMLAAVPVALLIELPSFYFSPQSTTRNLQRDFRFWFRSCIFIGCVALALASPWMIKNVLFTGNPVYPLAWGVFGGGEWSRENAQFYMDKSSLKGFHPRHDRHFGETLRHVVLTPFEATVFWRLIPGKHPGYEDHFLGPLYLLWLPLLLRVLMDMKHRTPRTGPLRLTVFFTFAYCALWYATYQSNRLLIPALGAFSVLMVYAIALVAQTSPAVARGATVVLLAGCMYNWEWSARFIFHKTTQKPSPAAWWLGRQSRHDYVRQAFPPYAVFQMMPDHVKEGESVLFVGEYRGCHCPVAWRAADWFDTPLILHYIRQTRDNDELLDRLLAEKTRWVFYNDAELIKYEADYFLPRFSAAERARFFDLWKPGQADPDGFRMITAHPRLRPAVSLSGMHLFEILPRPQM
ncbi:MAG: hypothetical protein N3D11_09095 [Candidatus Sumerlaeia bacterium]|nr:hypothetical protein [Candidatus Sumerlaeia bacterium]